MTDDQGKEVACRENLGEIQLEKITLLMLTAPVNEGATKIPMAF